MILILSQAKGEPTTEIVIQWIESLGGKSIRFNGIDMIKKNISIGLNTTSTEIFKKISNNTEKIGVIWYRRYKSVTEETINNHFDYKNLMEFKFHKAMELKHFYTLILDSLNGVKMISSPSLDKDLNKLITLRIADKEGIIVPESLIANNKNQIKEFLVKYNECIIKPIWNTSYFRKDGFSFKMLTKKLTLEFLENLPNEFIPTFIQEYIPKEYEVRTFYWFGNFYSMAIFSQDNKKTQVDFRNYDKTKPNRTVSYKLPVYLEKKVTSLMEKLSLDSGSIDFIKTRNDEYVFLEINPNGQFGMVSHPCNYNLEEVVARKLIELDSIHE